MNLADTVILILAIIAFICGVVVTAKRQLVDAERMAKIMTKLKSSKPH